MESSEAAAERHYRQRAFVLLVSALTVCLATGLIAALFGAQSGVPSHPSKRFSVASSTTPHITQPHITHQSAVSFSSGLPEFVNYIGIAGGNLSFASTCQADYLSRNFGRTWTNITPATIHLGPASVCNMGGPIFSNATGRLYMEIGNVPGLGNPYAPGSGGSSRGGGLEISDNEGTSWTLTEPPGCSNGCGQIGVLENGNLFELATDGDLYLASPTATNWTIDRTLKTPGAAWDIGPVALNGLSSIWGLNYRGNSPGQELLHSVDGETSWRRVDPGGGATSMLYQLPILFGTSRAVMLGYGPTKTNIRDISIYTTSNDGRSWISHPLPNVSSPNAYTPFGANAPVLAAQSPTDWYVADSNGLYSTSNAGKSWTLISKGLPWSYNGVIQMTFSTMQFGYVIPANSTQSTLSLWVTTDGGRRWHSVNDIYSSS